MVKCSDLAEKFQNHSESSDTVHPFVFKSTVVLDLSWKVTAIHCTNDNDGAMLDLVMLGC